jgi:DNA-binding MarR family transcriptional regulator
MMSRDTDVEHLNAALHALMLRLNVARLDLWSDKLAGIGYLDLHAMSFVEEKPDHTLAEMREHLQVPQSTLTSIINRLEKRELVRRDIHPTDKRSFLIRLTAKGEELQREHHRVESAIVRKILEALPSRQDRAQFVALFRKIASNL